jgi:hypothetical protein
MRERSDGYAYRTRVTGVVTSEQSDLVDAGRAVYMESAEVGVTECEVRHLLCFRKLPESRMPIDGNGILAVLPRRL